MLAEPRLVVANLDCEDDWAARSGSSRGSRLPAEVLGRVARIATLLRALADDGDVLWLPAALDGVERPTLAAVDGLPAPALVSGPLERLPTPSRALVWGATEATEGISSSSVSESPSSGDPAEARGRRALHELAWTWPTPDATAACRANDRAVLLEALRARDLSLPGARIVHDAAELRAAIHALPPSAGTRWVLKSRHSAAGRARALGAGDELEGPRGAEAIRLLARTDGALFEPWVERTGDFGLCAVVDRDEVRVLGIHRSLADRRGGVRALEVVSPAAAPPLAPAHARRVTEVARDLGVWLRASGYLGPFGIDGFLWRDADGAEHLRPCSELNARLTLGFVAHALRERLANRHERLAPGLRLGFLRPRAASSSAPATAEAGLPLVHDATGAPLAIASPLAAPGDATG